LSPKRVGRTLVVQEKCRLARSSEKICRFCRAAGWSGKLALQTTNPFTSIVQCLKQDRRTNRWWLGPFEECRRFLRDQKRGAAINIINPQEKMDFNIELCLAATVAKRCSCIGIHEYVAFSSLVRRPLRSLWPWPYGLHS